MKHNRTNNVWFRMSRVIIEYWLRIFGTSAAAQAASGTTHVLLAVCFAAAFPAMLVYALLLATYKYNEKRPAPARVDNVRDLVDMARRGVL